MALIVVFIPLFFGGVLAAGETGDWRVLGIAVAVSLASVLMSVLIFSMNRIRNFPTPDVSGDRQIKA